MTFPGPTMLLLAPLPRKIPCSEFPRAAVPAALVPIRLSLMTLPVDPAPVMLIPAASSPTPLPEITFPERNTFEGASLRNTPSRTLPTGGRAVGPDPDVVAEHGIARTARDRQPVALRCRRSHCVRRPPSRRSYCPDASSVRDMPLPLFAGPTARGVRADEVAEDLIPA